jgi:uncharacterized membrane protein YebE (DUF533 family)
VFDPERLLGNMIGGALGGAFGGKKGRKKSMFRTGSMATKATVGLGLLGVAMAAFEHFSQNKQTPAPAPGGAPMPPPPPPTHATTTPPPPPPGMPIVPPAPTSALTAPAASVAPLPALPAPRADVTLLIQAMIAAAAADGRIDDSERSAILERAEGAGLDAETRAFLHGELAAPLTLAQVVARTRAAVAADVYAASLVAITLDTDAERAYLDQLASALTLDAQTRSAIHAELAEA